MHTEEKKRKIFQGEKKSINIKRNIELPRNMEWTQR
jgi:hypothetical protein